MEIRDRGTADIFNGIDSKAARKVCPSPLHRLASRKLQALNAATALSDLRVPSGNRLHALTDDRAGQHAIAINDQFRICFRWIVDEAVDVEITDYH
jgi:proteic killer suppression protein